ncbi:MAG: hypothetical protein RH951_07300 [Parvibaculum sp.]
MSEDAAAVDLLPLLFTTALVVYVLAMGSADLARTIIRVSALTSVAFCLTVWGAAALSYDDWGRPVIDEFYATAIVERQLGPVQTGWLLLALAVIPVVFGLREMWRLKAAR